MTETPADHASPGTGAGWWEQRRWLWRGLVVLPIVVAVVRALIHGWFPVGDNALLAVRAYDVATPHHPLLGSWTSASLALGIDVNNPGPLYPDLLAPWMWTVGRIVGIGPATALGVGTVNVAAACGTFVAGHRVGGWRAERWLLLLVAALTWSMGSELLIDIWQPHALLLPFVCLLVLTSGLLAGRLRVLPWWLGVLSLIVQTHVAYVYVGAVLGLLVVASAAREVVGRARRDGVPVGVMLRSVLRHRVVGVGAAVLAIAWLQPLIEQLTGRGEGNLQRLATHAGGGDLTVGAGSAVKIVAAVVSVPPFWTRFGFEDAVPSTPLTQTDAGPRLELTGLPQAAVAVVTLAVVIGVLVFLLAVLRTPAQRMARSAAGVALAGLVVAIGGVTIQTVSVTGLGNHQVRWIFALGAFVHVTIVWGLVEWWQGRQASAVGARADRGWCDRAVMAAVGVLVLANLPVHAAALGPTADRQAGDVLDRVFDDLDGFDPPGPVRYDTSNIRVFEPYSWAIVMRLRELGVDFRFTGETDVRQYGESRRVDGSEVGVVGQLERADALLYEGTACTLSMRSGISADAERDADALIDAAVADLASGNLAIDTSGLPDELLGLLDGAMDGVRGDAYRFVAAGLVPVLIDEARVDPTPALRAAADGQALIIARVNSTLRVIAEPATLCAS